jgi:glycosyltransferase Alg8
MERRFGKKPALNSLVVPAFLYFWLAWGLGYLFWPYFYYVKNEMLLSLGAFAIWRYGWQWIHYSRSIIYSFFVFPAMRKKIEKIPFEDRFPDHIFFIIPSYREEAWVSRETIHSILSELGKIPSSATLIVATGADFDDQVIKAIYDTHPVKEKVDLIFQRQSNGKRIAMGHALRKAARIFNHRGSDARSVTFFMDGDSYLEPRTLMKTLPFFRLYPKLGALTTNEIAFIDSQSSWYKDWFNLKFGQRHILFQSHSLSRKVMTLTGRFSLFRTHIVLEEDFISQIENDILINWRHGKFRFLMGDDKSSWFYVLKHGWEMLYIPDVLCYSLESRDGHFLEVSRSLPFRWYGNTLRNNQRALDLGWKKTGFFIWLCILDQKLSMWTSLVGLVSALVLSIFRSFIYLPVFISWVLFVRILQMSIIAYRGHPVSVRTIPLMLYNQWVGAIIKIKAFFQLDNQSWAKGKTTQKTKRAVMVKVPFIQKFPLMLWGVSYFFFGTAVLLADKALLIPPMPYLTSQEFRNKLTHIKKKQGIKQIDVMDFGVIPDDTRDDGAALTRLIRNLPEDTPCELLLPAGHLTLNTPVQIRRSNLIMSGKGKGKTFFDVSMRLPEQEAILIEGEKGTRLGRLAVATAPTDTRLVLRNMVNVSQGSIVLMTTPNTSSFLAGTGAEHWNKELPHIRQTLVKVVKSVSGTELLLDRWVDAHYPEGITELFRVSPVVGVKLRHFTMEYILNDVHPDPDVFLNKYPQSEVDFIALRWTLNCRICHIKLLNAGRHPLNLEWARSCKLDHLSIDGSWNKGKGGNGYVRLARSHLCEFSYSSIEHIRHITLQWSSSRNHLHHLNTHVDINLHGGGEHHNRIDHIHFISPWDHKWPPVTVTGKRAHWAPPTGTRNLLDGQLIGR